MKTKVDPAGVPVCSRAKHKEGVVELSLFFIEVALSERSAVSETGLAANRARGPKEA